MIEYYERNSLYFVILIIVFNLYYLSSDFIHMVENKGFGDKVVPIFISVYPLRDSVGQLKIYGQDFHKSIVRLQLLLLFFY